MSKIVVGLDFGTSNTSVSYADLDTPGPIKTVTLEETDDGKTTYKTMPSAMFYIPGPNKLLVGRKALDAYINREYEGRLLRNLKSILDNVDAKTNVSETKPPIPYKTFIYNFLKRVKDRVIEETGSDNIIGIVVGRPVHFFNNDDERDKKAEQNLRRIIEKLGFENIVFLEEPIAASFSLETKIPTDTTAFVADIGGGTSDFAAIALGPSHLNQENRKNDVFATTGIKTGGTDFDKSFAMRCFMPSIGLGTKIRLQNDSEIDFPRVYFDKLSNAFSINELYDYSVINEIERYYLDSLAQPKIRDFLHIIKTETGHNLITEVETCKKGLSYKEEYVFDKKTAFNLDGVSMTTEDLKGGLSEFNTYKKKKLESTNANILLDAIKSKLKDYAKQYLDREQRYRSLFEGKETNDVKNCITRIDNIIENWANKISLISVDDIKEKFMKHKKDIEDTNNRKIKDNLGKFRNTEKFEINFEADFNVGYNIFDDLLKLPEEQIKEILEKEKENIYIKTNYKEEFSRRLFEKLRSNKSLSDDLIGRLRKDIENKLDNLNNEELEEKLQGRTREEYTTQELQQTLNEEYIRKTSINDFIAKQREARKETLKSFESQREAKISNFLTDIKNSTFVGCSYLTQAPLLDTINQIIDFIEIYNFDSPDLNELEDWAKSSGAIFTQEIIKREAFERSLTEHTEKIKKSILDCIKKSGKDKSEFKYLIMTGGSSRIPKVRKTIKECFSNDIKVICEDLSEQKNVENPDVIKNIDTPDDISVGLCMYAMNIFK